MEIKLNKKDNTQGTLVVRLTEVDYKEKVENKLRNHAKKASIKGFRPGKVPVAVIKQMYGASILVDEINHILGHKVEDYLKENNLNIIGKPLPNFDKANEINWETQKEFEFSYDLGLVPDFKVEITPKIKVEKLVIKVDKKIIDDTVTNIRQQSSKSDKAEISKEGDFLNGKLVGTNFEQEIMIPTNQIEKDKKIFIGLKPNDVIEFDLQKVFDKDATKIGYLTGLKADEAKELKGNFKFTVDSITRTVPAELNQELFDKIFGKDAVKNETEFLKKIEETISENYDRESMNLLFRSLIDELVEKFDFKLSEDFITRFIKANNNKITDEELKKSLSAYVHDLKWSLIRAEINKELKVEIPTEVVVDAARNRILAQFNMMSIPEGMEEQFAPIVDNYLREDNGRNFLNEYENLLTTEILDKIKDKITIKEKKVSLEEFNKETAKK